MKGVYRGTQFFFFGKSAAHRDYSSVPPLDPRSYLLPIRGERIKSPNDNAAREAVERAWETVEKLEQEKR